MGSGENTFYREKDDENFNRIGREISNIQSGLEGREREGVEM